MVNWFKGNISRTLQLGWSDPESSLHTASPRDLRGIGGLGQLKTAVLNQLNCSHSAVLDPEIKV